MLYTLLNLPFAALKADGSVVTWGRGRDSIFGYVYGGDSSSVASELSSGVSNIYSTNNAFAALKADGSVVTWGNNGGDSSSVASELSSGVILYILILVPLQHLKTMGQWSLGVIMGEATQVA